MKLKNFFAGIIIFVSYANAKSQNDTTENYLLVNKVVQKYYALKGGLDSPSDVWGNYTLDLTFEAMIAYGKASKDENYLKDVQDIMKLRGQNPESVVPYTAQPFGCLTFALFEESLDSSYLPGFLSETNRMYQEVPRWSNGAVLHKYQDKYGMLIDYVQEYASRMAKAGSVTGEGWYFEEAVRQFEIYDSIVCDKETGLYRQGIGFLEDTTQLSPGFWSRGQGWILRGMVSTLVHLPENSEYRERLQNLLLPFVDSLITKQDSNGMWHQLVDYPFEDSYAETSGTGFIAYYLALAVKSGFLPEEVYAADILKSVKGVKEQIAEDGSILNACKGPGPIVTTDNYYRNPGIVNESHSFATTIYALAGELLITPAEDTMIIDIPPDTLDNSVVVKKENINIYPNPATGKVHISLADNVDEVEIQIINLQGIIEKVELKKGETSFELDVSNLKTGIYLITIKIAKTKLVKKLVIE